MDWNAVHRLMHRAVARGFERRGAQPVEYLGIDEKSFGRGQSYGSVVSDLAGKRVLEVIQNRDQEGAATVLQSLPQEQRQGVRAVAMDMWQPFIKAAGTVLPPAAILFDKFHLVRLLTGAVDKVRKAEHSQMQAVDDQRLKGSKYLWLKSPAKQGEEQWLSFKTLLAINLKTGRAWMLAQTFEGFWQRPDSEAARLFFKQWFARAKRSQLPPVKSAADTLRKHLESILTYFQYPITNASAEGLNSLIQAIKSAARGFRSFANYRVAILFHLGKLDLKPLTTHTFA